MVNYLFNLMSKKEWKKVFNLNTYQWWRNHRRVVTFTLLLFAFGYYVRYPSEDQLRNKKLCGNFFGGNSEESRKAKKAFDKLGVEIAQSYCEYFN